MTLLRRLAASLLLVVPLLPPPAAAGPRVYAGVVTHVSDGDTVWVRPARGGPPMQLRLLGVDAPEICQRFGRQSREALQRLVLNRRVLVEDHGRDGYERVLARLERSGRDVNGWLVEQGLAWSHRYRSRPGPYADLQAQAREARRGLWAASQPLEPRDFRRLHGPCTAPGPSP